jgi:hypothetical protein
MNGTRIEALPLSGVFFTPDSSKQDGGVKNTHAERDSSLSLRMTVAHLSF